LLTASTQKVEEANLLTVSARLMWNSYGPD
jgi:hypothetical protein